MFGQKSGIQQSVAGTVMNVVIQYVIQQLAGGFLSGGAKGQAPGGIGNIMSLLSNLGGKLNAEHPLVKEVQQKTNIQDSQQATRYTGRAVDFIKEEAGANPQGIESLFGITSGTAVGGAEEHIKKGLGGFVKGLFGSKDK